MVIYGRNVSYDLRCDWFNDKISFFNNRTSTIEIVDGWTSSWRRKNGLVELNESSAFKKSQVFELNRKFCMMAGSCSQKCIRKIKCTERRTICNKKCTDTEYPKSTSTFPISCDLCPGILNFCLSNHYPPMVPFFLLDRSTFWQPIGGETKPEQTSSTSSSSFTSSFFI